jgi:hypothetical protein
LGNFAEAGSEDFFAHGFPVELEVSFRVEEFVFFPREALKETTAFHVI